MNLLFLDSIDTKTYGGMEEWICLVATGLTERGHRVTIAARPDSEFVRRLKKDASGVRILETNLSGDLNPLAIGRLMAYMKENKIDVVSVNFNRDVRLGGLAARLQGQARVIWSVGLDITRDNAIHRFVTPKLIDGVIVPSKALKGQITQSGYIDPDMVEVIPIGIKDIAQTEASEARRELLDSFNLSDKAVVAVTSGRFIEQKGHRYLIDAAVEVVSGCPDLIFLWLGNGPLENELKSEITRRGLEKHFIFAGMVDDVSPLLSGSDLMVHPSIEEPFGIAILEGMRAGLPVVASDVGGIGEVVEDGQTAILVEPRNSGELSHAISDLLSDRHRRQSMGTSGRNRWREHFSYSMMIDRIESYFQQFVSEVSRSGQA